MSAFALDEATAVLARTPATLRAMLGGLPDAWTTATEGPDTWSPYDVLGHLIHGERTDWIPRARIILAQGAERTFAPFDRFAQFRESEVRSLAELLDALAAVRAENLATLASWRITEAQLGLTGEHPAFGAVTLRQLLATWVAHDLGHVVQVSRVMAKRYRDDVGPWRAYLSVMDAGPVRLPLVAGADGCSAGWVLVRARPDGAGLEARLCADVRALLDACEGVTAIGIDIPIGLAADGPRAADTAARAVLGPRRSSVFPAPVRAVLEARDYADAARRSRAAQGKSLSQQAFHLLPKIREVDATLRASAADAARVHEVHPEVSWRCWNGGRPMAYPKRTPEGRAERLALAEAWQPGAFAAARAAIAPRDAADDDLLDAIAACWSAARIADGRAESFPAGAPPVDEAGLRMVIRA